MRQSLEVERVDVEALLLSSWVLMWRGRAVDGISAQIGLGWMGLRGNQPAKRLKSENSLCTCATYIVRTLYSMGNQNEELTFRAS